MDYEKKYKAALEIARYYHDAMEGDVLCVLEECFQELKESEDEQIREQILDYFVAKKVNESQPVLDSWIAWLEKQKEFVSADFDDVWETADCDELTVPLEKYSKDAIKEMCHAWYDKGIELERKYWLKKQGEQKPFDYENANIQQKDYSSIDPHFCKPIDKVESKFKVGDWIITNYGKVNQVVKVDEDGDGYTLDDDTYFSGSWISMYRPWTIEDAKDGDVLSAGQLIILFKQWEANADCNFAIAHAGVDISGKLQITNGHWLISNKSIPANKSQRDLLFQKMVDAGYTFDFKKKELKKIKLSRNHIRRNSYESDRIDDRRLGDEYQ